VSESAEVWAVLLGLLRAYRWTVIGYALVLVSAVIGVRLGEAYNLWFYQLALPLAQVAAREVPRSIADRRTRRVEHERVRTVARERGSNRHLRGVDQ
jgi:hypothetical protein